MRWVFLAVAGFCVVIAVLQWRRNEAGDLDTAVSELDRRLKQLMPVVPAVLGAIAIVLFISG